MNRKYVFIAAMLLSVLLVSMGLTTIYVNMSEKQEQSDEVLIVTSFYPMYIAALNVTDGIDGVRLVNLSEPQTGCLHDFQLTPADMQLLSTADAFVINGGGIESFMESVAKSYPDLPVISACDGIELIAEEDEHNAHAWMSIPAYRMQVENIADGLSQLDSEHAKEYQTNAGIYDEKLAGLQSRQETLAWEIDFSSVILFHEAYAYVAQDLGLEVAYVMDLDEERQVSAGEVAEVLQEIEQNDIPYIFAEELYGSEMGRTVEAESDVQVIYLDPLNRGDYDKDSYIEGMQANLDKLEAITDKKQ